MPDDATGKQSPPPQRKPDGKFLPGHSQGFQPGISGNPSGLPKGYQRMDRAIMREMARDPGEPEPPPKTHYEKVARKIRDQAGQGESKQQDMTIRNNDGPPVQRVDTDVTVKRYAWGEGEDPLGLDESDEEVQEEETDEG